jgi:DnaJ-class molecular chaperone
LATHYETLGVEPTASHEEIRSAYRRLALRHHPDVNGGSAAAANRFREIAAAWEILGDASARAAYDERLNRGTARPRSRTASPPDPPPERPPPRGPDITRRIRVTMASIYAGFPVTVRQAHVRDCPRCAGRGLIRGVPCPRCEGRGLARRTTALEVRLPPGAASGLTIRLGGQGDVDVPGGRAGDLYLTIAVAGDPTFRRVGDDVEATVDLPFHVAALGGDVVVPLPDGGRCAVDVPAGTQHDAVLRYRDLGFPTARGRRGALVLTVRITVPGRLTFPERQALERFSQVAVERPRLRTRPRPARRR